ncbi:DNA-binding MarR family transcriptional regulator [Paenibacillus taihuensis]|uniref:DNA-binding MarR family transcriptional regulator n=1 Tax=Paenibacillus taihuensis TaxID=1156355 RepID=A0A3D9QV72_9BACL|nr:MarR family transcriptional regulator [Paenibacillus taihuensis]REE66724.1 DNA-binding MarR family transcriptional regulator [Paenibacillus taihuensis]
MLESYFQNCMFFASNLLNRAITKMAEEEFKPTGLSPTYAFMMMAVQEQPGITQKELGKALHVTPSTITRFIEKLAYKGLVITRSEGKMSRVELTTLGIERMEVIREAWKSLFRRYVAILGKEEGRNMTKMLYDLGKQLED